MTRSTIAADTRAAHAALNRPQESDHEFDRYLLVDDTDEFATEIRFIFREHFRRNREALS